MEKINYGEIGFKPSYYENENIFKVGLYNSKEVMRLIHESKEYFLDIRKIEHLKEICTDGIGL